MTAPPLFPIEWCARERALAPLAVVAQGPVGRALARRVLARDDAALSALRGVGAPGLLVLLGDEVSLPWVDGVTYLGRDPAAPALLVPTTRAPVVASALVERALLARFAGLAVPLAVLLAPARVVPVGAARPVARARLSAWLAEAS